MHNKYLSGFSLLEILISLFLLSVLIFSISPLMTKILLVANQDENTVKTQLLLYSMSEVLRSSNKPQIGVLQKQYEESIQKFLPDARLAISYGKDSYIIDLKHPFLKKSSQINVEF